MNSKVTFLVFISLLLSIQVNGVLSNKASKASKTSKTSKTQVRKKRMRRKMKKMKKKHHVTVTQLKPLAVDVGVKPSSAKSRKKNSYKNNKDDNDADADVDDDIKSESLESLESSSSLLSLLHNGGGDAKQYVNTAKLMKKKTYIKSKKPSLNNSGKQQQQQKMRNKIVKKVVKKVKKKHNVIVEEEEEEEELIDIIGAEEEKENEKRNNDDITEKGDNKDNGNVLPTDEDDETENDILFPDDDEDDDTENDILFPDDDEEDDKTEKETVFPDDEDDDNVDDNLNNKIDPVEPGTFQVLEQTYNLLGDDPTNMECDKVLRTFTIDDVKYIIRTFFAEIKSIFDEVASTKASNEASDATDATSSKQDGYYSEYYKNLSGLFTDDVFGFTSDDLDKVEQKIISQLDSAVQIRTICAYCDNRYRGFAENKSEYDKYCGRDSYEYQSQMSGTAFFPVKQYEDTSMEYSIVKGVTFDSFLHFRDFSFSYTDSVVQLLSWYLPQIYTQLIASSMGSISLAFHQSGYMASNNLTPSPLIRKSVVASTLPLFYKVKNIVSKETNQQSSLGNKASFSGYGEGGYSAIAAADAFSDQGISPTVISGGAPLKTRTVGLLSPLSVLFNDSYYYYYYDEGGLSLQQLLLPYLIGLPLTTDGALNQSPRIDLSNSQDFLQFIGMDYFEMFTDPTLPSGYFDSSAWYLSLEAYWEGESTIQEYTILDALMAGYGINTAPTELHNLYTTSDNYDPCSVPDSSYNALCEALNENDLSSILENAQYHIHLCHSFDDELISYHNLPNQFLNPTYVSITETMGGHDQGRLICSLEFLSLLSQMAKE